MEHVSKISKSETVKYECELCIESYNLYDQKPYSLVPCGHSMCLRCLDSLQKAFCPFCRSSFTNKIPNWEIIKRLPKPTIPIIYYQIQIKFNSLRALSDEFSSLIIKLNTDLKDNLSKPISEDVNNLNDEKLKIVYKKIEENHRDNLEIEMNLKKLIEQLNKKLDQDEYKYNDENLKKIKNEIEKISSKIIEKINSLKKDHNDINLILNSNTKLNTEVLKKIEYELYDKKKNDIVNQQLNTILSTNIIRPASNANTNEIIENQTAETETLQFRTTQKIVIVTVVLIGLFVLMLYPIAMIIIGALNKTECSINNLIPIWLIVGGGSGIVVEMQSALLLVYSLFRSFHHRSFTEKLLYIFILIVPLVIVSVFNMAWFFTGNAWIYPIYKNVQFEDKTLLNSYCNQTLYLFSFWTLNLAYILFGLFLLTANLICCCICFIKK